MMMVSSLLVAVGGCRKHAPGVEDIAGSALVSALTPLRSSSYVVCLVDGELVVGRGKCY
jgi:hypothetical protein